MVIIEEREHSTLDKVVKPRRGSSAGYEITK